MFKIFQVLVSAVLAAGIVAYFKKRKHRKNGVLVCLIGLLAVSSLFSNTVLKYIPIPTNEVIVTAVGEKNPLASRNEVSMKGYLVGGKEYPVETPYEGKWFWKGTNVYRWREESDPRQPEGTTRSITLGIPYGKDRAIQFYASKWNGIVEVTYDGVSQRYDLFPTGNEKLVNAAVPDTESVALYSAKIFRLLLFAVMIIMLMAYPCYAANKFDNERINKFFLRHWSRFIYGILAICCFAVMFYNGGKVSFWADEILTLGWIYLGYPGPKNIYLLLNELWFHLMPYGQEYLLVMPELLVAISVYMAGIAGELYKGKRFGVIMAAVFATSFPAVVQGGNEFRPYALLLFSMSGLLYFYIKKQKERGQKKSTLIIYVMFLLLAMDTHHFGFVFAGLIMMSDFLLIVLKKTKPIAMAEFIFPGLYAIYWISSLKTSEMSGYGGGWAAEPSLYGVVTIARWLCSNSDLLLSLLLIGLAITFVYLADRSSWKSAGFWKSYTVLTLFLVPVLLFALTFLYSSLFKGASVFVNRYFTPVLPNVVFFTAVAIDTAIEVLSQKAQGIGKKTSIACTLSCILILCTINWSGLPTVYSHKVEDFRGSAEYLMSQSDIYSPSTICLVYGNQYHNAGFDYYLTHNGKRDPIYHKSVWDEMPDNVFEYETIYCIYHHRSFDSKPFIENGYVEVESNASLALKKYVKSGNS